MKSWSFAVVGLACLIAAGCRADPNIALLERELRLQEDEIYRLRGAVADYQAALRSCGESAVPRGRSKTSEPARGGVPELPQPEGVPSPLEETKPSPQGTYGNRGSEAPPSPYKGSSGLPPGSGKPNGPSGKAPVERPNGLKRPVPNPSGDKGLGDGMRVQPTGGMEPVLPADSRHVCQVVLSGLLTGGYDSDGRPGDEGIAVVLQPRDAHGRAVGAPADVSVVVLDPALEGEAARVARWDVPAAEIAAQLRNGGSDGTIRLEMPWPGDPPVHSQLYLFVRYTTRDGRQLQAEGPIQITLAGQPGRRWVPAKPAASAPQASRPADLGRPDPTEPRPIRGTPAVRTAAPQSPPSVGGPAEPKLRPPVWSPDRP